MLGLPGNPLAAMMALSTVGAPLLAAGYSTKHGHYCRKLGPECVTYLAGARNAVFHHFRAGQQQPDQGLALDRQLVVPGQGCHCQVRRVELHPGRYQDVTFQGFLAGFADVLAGARFAGPGTAADHQNRQAVVVLSQPGALTAQHCLCARWDESARHNGAGLMRCQPASGLREDPRPGAVDGPAVHRGRRVVRHVLQCHNVLVQPPSQGEVQRHRSGRDGCGCVEGGLPCFLPRVGKVVVRRVSFGWNRFSLGFGGHPPAVPETSAS